MQRIKQVFRYRAVLREFVVRDLRLRYEGAVLGYFWTLFEPLLLTLVYYVVFGIVGRFEVDNYILFLVLGMLPWVWFSGSVTAGTRSIRNRAGVLTKIYIPREIAPLSVVIARGVEYLASMPVLLAVILLTGVNPTALLWLMPIAWIAQFALVTGVSLATSVANVLARDTERILGVLLRFTFYATPILYPLDSAIDAIPSSIAWLYWLNPLTGIMEAYRAGFYPELFAGWERVAVGTGESILIFWFGWWIFSRLERKVLKEL